MTRSEGFKRAKLEIAVGPKVEEINFEISRNRSVLIFIAASFTRTVQVTPIPEYAVDMVGAYMPDAQIWIATVIDAQAPMNPDVGGRVASCRARLIDPSQERIDAGSKQKDSDRSCFHRLGS
ncbi:MAG TPA: hypothetical protein VN612_17015 [Acidobacteriaceae bacterium]|nr:hypothetical protein [Acidobacteriaceae bacterium]